MAIHFEDPVSGNHGPSVPDKPSAMGQWLIKPGSMIVAMIGLFLVFSAIAVFLSYMHITTTRENILLADRTTTSLLAIFIGEYEKSVTGVLQSFASRPSFIEAVKQKNVPNARRHLEDLKKHHEIDLTFVTDPRGVLWLNYPSFPEAIGKDLSYRDWYKGISAHCVPYISEVFQLIVANKPLAVAIAVPVVDEKGKVIGILANSHRLEFLKDTIERVPFSHNTAVTVIDRKGHNLYSNQYPYQGKITDYLHLPMVEQAVSEKQQQKEDTRHKDLGKLYLSVAPVGNMGWTVIVERKLDDIYRSEFRRFAEIGGAALLLFVLTSLFLAYLRRFALYRKTEELLAAQKNALENEVRFRTAIEGAPDAIFIQTMGRFAYVNNVALKLFGASSEEQLLGELVLTRFDPDYYEIARDRIRLLNEEKQSVPPIEEKILKLDGTPVDVEISAVPFIYKDHHGALVFARDITHRKKAEIALLESLERFQLANQATFNAIWDWNLQTDALWWNDNFYKLFGYLVEEIEPGIDSWTDRIHPEDRDRVVSGIHSAIDSGGQSWSDEYRFQRKDGRYALIVDRGFISRDSNDKPVRMIGAMEDITQRKQAEERVRVTHERLQRFIDSNIFGVAIVDATGKIFEANDYYLNLVGFTREEFEAGRVDWRSITPPEWLPADEKAIRELRERGTCTPYEKEYVHRDGARVPVFIADAMLPGPEEQIAAFVLDISELRRAEEELFNEKTFSDKLLNAQMDTVFLFDPATGKPIRWNNRFAEVVGYQDEEITVMKAPDDFYDEDDLRKAEECTPKILTEGQGIVEMSLVTKSGRRIPFEYAVTLVETGDGTTLLLSIGRDITDRKRAEEVVREERNLSESIINSLPGIFYLLNAQGKFVRWNRNFEIVSGFSHEEMLERQALDFFAGQEKDLVEQRIRDALVQGEASVEARFVSKNGISSPYLLTGVRIEINGQPHVMGMGLDITELREVEEALRESEERLTFVLKGSHLGSWDWNLETNEVTRNERWAEMLGYNLQDIEFTVKQWTDFIHPDDQALAARSIREHIEGLTDMHKLEYRMRTKDGQYRWILDQAKVVKYSSDGRPIRMSGTHTDITNRKLAEEEIRRLNEELEQRVRERTAQLEVTNKELEAFSYSVSHDLRAPLRSIDGFSQVLLEDYRDKLDELGKDYLDRVRKGAQKMGFLIDDLLKLSRVGRYELRRETVDLSRMARNLIESYRRSEPERVLEGIVQTGIVVQGDPYLLEIALRNLLDNAWKFTGKTARARIEFGTRVKDGKIVCFVRDNGVGFDMTYADKLFGAFQRLHKTEEFPGTGIGLATVKRIISRHGGEIWAEGKIGEGAIFYFTLPS